MCRPRDHPAAHTLLAPLSSRRRKAAPLLSLTPLRPPTVLRHTLSSIPMPPRGSVCTASMYHSFTAYGVAA
jgi:hypothetical protein